MIDLAPCTPLVSLYPLAFVPLISREKERLLSLAIMTVAAVDSTGVGQHVIDAVKESEQWLENTDEYEQ